ncbi:penicillin-binding protein activator [Pontibaca methylaminivorans]|uniref:penicillin-binding protein activator n=1 Tax=Pontibaca methylaminivorans TaxID=515897 RepID=UPI002FD996C1
MVATFHSARKLALYAFALLTMLALAACDEIAAPGAGPSVESGQPVTVALLVPQGSGQPGDGVLSKSLENAARLAIADLNGRPQINLRVYDTAGNATTAAAQARKAVEEGASIILGPLYAESANAAGIAVRDSGVSVLSFSNNPSIAGGNVFVLGQTFDNSAERLMRFASSRGKRSIVAVYGNDLAGEMGYSAIRKAASASSARLSGAVSYDISQQSVVAAVPRVSEAVKNADADAVFLTANTAGALPLFAQMLPEAGVSPQDVQFIGLTRWDIPPQTLAIPGVQGGWFALPDPVRTAAFNGRYAAAYGGQPHAIGGLAYDGIAIVGALLRNGRTDLGTAALTQGAGFQGVSGAIRLRRDGSNECALAIATVRDQKVVVVDPAPRSFSGAGS